MAYVTRIVKLIKLLCNNRELVFVGPTDHIEKTIAAQDFNLGPRCDKPERHFLKQFISVNSVTSKTHFLVFLSNQYTDSYSEWLKTLGFEYEKDCFFIKHRPLVIPNVDCTKTPYIDHYGNKAIGDFTETKVIFTGFDSSIQVSKSTLKNTISLSSDSRIIIDNTKSYGMTIKCDAQSEIVINSCYLEEDTEIICHKESRIYLDERTHILKSSRIISHDNIEIHKDCLISRSCLIMSGYGQTLFDTETKLPLTANNRIIVGDHVWIGERCTILSGTWIGEGSAVLAQSTTNSPHPNNVLIAGSIATVMKKNIAWSRSNSSDITSCEPYTKNTSDNI